MGKVFLKICALILGSALFLPLSCTSSTIAGVFLFVELDTRYLTRGEAPYSSFCVLAIPSGENQLPHIMPLYHIDSAYLEENRYHQPLDTDQYSFLLPQPAGVPQTQKWEGDDYKVIALSPEKQLIELKTYAEDYVFTHIYMAERNRVEPLRSKVLGPGQMFEAAPLAFLIALGLYGIGRWLRRKCYPEGISVGLSYTVVLIILGGLVPVFLGMQIPLLLTGSGGSAAPLTSFSNATVRTLWIWVYIGLAIGCWITAWLRIRRHAFALTATTFMSTLLIIFIPFGTGNYVYWLSRIRKNDSFKTEV